jgi:hypothetical protein
VQLSNWIAGTVTIGGAGPCYGIETDEGQQYALYGEKGTVLTRGTKVRVLGEPLTLRIYCGPGQHLRIVKVETI